MSAKKQIATAVVTSPAVAARPASTSPGPFPWSMIYLFARIFYAVRMRSEDALKPYNLTPMQFTILATLDRQSGLSSAALSRRFNVTPQTMGEMVANLERRSLLIRGQDQSNRRALRLSLTDAGRRLVKTCDAAMDKVESALLEGLTPRQRDELKTMLAALHDHLGLHPN
jgi:DNA-binding MarR family transcriptional regulator